MPNQLTIRGATTQPQSHISIMPYSYHAIIQGTWDFFFDQLQWTRGYLLNFIGAAQNDQLDFKLYLAPGIYDLLFFTTHSPNCAIATVLLDGVPIGTIDLYATATVNNVREIIPSAITVTAAGFKTLSLKAATRNPSSGNWFMAIGYLALYKTP